MHEAHKKNERMYLDNGDDILTHEKRRGRRGPTTGRDGWWQAAENNIQHVSMNGDGNSLLLVFLLLVSLLPWESFWNSEPIRILRRPWVHGVFDNWSTKWIHLPLVIIFYGLIVCKIELKNCVSMSAPKCMEMNKNKKCDIINIATRDRGVKRPRNIFFSQTKLKNKNSTSDLSSLRYWPLDILTPH